MILVTGATGNVGGELTRILAEARERVRALVRRDAELPESVEGFVGDLNRPDTLDGALAGVRGIHLLAGYDDMQGFLARAKSAGVEHVVLQSSNSVPSGDMSNAVARYHILAEQAVRDSGLAWTFLRPHSFMTKTLDWVPQLQAGDVVREGFPDVPISTIDPHDIAAVSARALTTVGHAGKSYRLTGPELLLPADRVRILGSVLGRDLRFEALSDDEARAEMSAAMPAEYVDAFMSLFVDGTLNESEVVPTVQEVTGRPPGTFEQWAIAHAGAFR